MASAVFERVRAGQLENGHRDGGLAVEIAVDVVVFGAQFDAFFNRVALDVVFAVSDQVSKKDVLPLLAAFDDDLAELLFVDQTTLGVDRELEVERGVGGRRRLTEPTGRDLRVLLADGFHHVAGGQLLGCQFLRIKPDSQAVVSGAQKRHIARLPFTRANSSLISRSAKLLR